MNIKLVYTLYFHHNNETEKKLLDTILTTATMNDNI